MKFGLILSLVFLNLVVVADEKQPEFLLQAPGFSKSFSRKQLLQMKELKTITVEKDPAYGEQKKIYSAVPLKALAAGVALEKMSSLSFHCRDGFSGAISKARAFNQDPSGAVAYIAIEKVDRAWAPLKPGKPETAGPFYLIWENPEKSKIMTEEWPYQLAGLELSEKPFSDQFPLTQPADHVGFQDPIRRGYDLFMTNCFVCHSFNGEGEGKIGPDLNWPYSPAEYFHEKYFYILVRNPQSLRRWNQARMPGFSKEGLSDQDLKNIWLYLDHMKDHKKTQ